PTTRTLIHTLFPYTTLFRSLQIGIGSSTMSSAELNDYVLNVVRPPLASAQGASIPYPYGGAPRVINVDLDLARLYAKGLSPSDVDRKSTRLNSSHVSISYAV